MAIGVRCRINTAHTSVTRPIVPNKKLSRSTVESQNREAIAESNFELERNRLSFPAHRMWVLRQFDICRLRSTSGACDIRRALDLVFLGV
jgi:hypothetical protein